MLNSSGFKQVALALVVVSVWQLGSAGEPAASAIAGVSSTKDRGIVSIVSDPTLVSGRLLLKVVAFNRMKEPATLSSADVKVTGADGHEIGLVPIEQLIKEAGKGGRSSSASMNNVHQSSNYSRPSTSRGSDGGLDVTNYTGANDSVDREIVERSATADEPHDRGAKAQKQVDDLKAGILQTVTVDSAKAAGGQVVTNKLKFGRKDSREINVVVKFNGEEHTFRLAVPPEL
jgi:hypothetical protein